VKKFMLFCAAVLLAAAATAAFATAAGTKAVTMQLVEKDKSFKFIDNPPKDKKHIPTAGDVMAFTSDLLTKSGKHIEHLEAFCTVTSGGVHGYSTCTGVMALTGGQLAATALIPTANTSTNEDISIVGGTGAYAGASGVLHTVSRGPNSPYRDDTLHLILPT
jgi:hypothetical protein